MSAADFLLAPEVQKLLKVVFAEPSKQFSAETLARKTKLDAGDVARTQEHLIKSGILNQHQAKSDEAQAVSANTSFVFYKELRSIALKSFAAAEPIRAMLRSKFKSSVLHAFVLGEDMEAIVELLVVHGQLVPDELEMSAACQKLSASIGRHLRVHVISSIKYAALTVQDHLGAKLAGASAIEIIAAGDTKAKPPAEREGLLQSARKKLAGLTR
ncbi:MAG TPA: hypothetical protein VLJ19_07265 [Variovorax sp.]|nr:hypothetical protein [Variovorax sp.]